MSIFQTSVLKKYLNELDQSLIDEKYKAFQAYFGNAEMQESIRNLKEEQFQEGFLRELFVNILGYTLNPTPNHNLTTEQKNVDDSKKADGAILKDGNVHAVIELKSTQTTDLDTIETQAFGYKNHNPKCVYVVTSNFEKLRFYIQNAVHHIDFDLFNLTNEQFALLWICLSKDSVLNDLPLKIKEASIIQEEKVTKHLYADYRKFREDLYNNLVEKNPAKSKLELFKKTQKLLDRFLFIFFAEDRTLLPANSISKIIEKWKDDVAFGGDRSLYETFKQYFNVLYRGRPKSGNREAIFAYNGGLFEPDDMLDNLNIDDDILAEHTLKLTAYDFETDVDVNILGHIFEHSLGEIENIQAEIKGEKVDTQKTRRKKDGIFYTPKYITKYIVENTIGKLCEDKKAELNITDERFGHSGKRTKKGVDDLQAYRDWLLDLKICDPACGSGAFLNQALEFLISEHRYLDEITAKYHKVPMVLSDVESSILENNIYGVDLNEESVEIAKLSLWLRTAQKGRKLNTLSDNIKCGNSLIDDPEVAGEKAFKWEEEFPEVFTQKKKKAWHITTATHNSRYSQRMFDNYVKLSDSVWLSEKEEVIVTQTVADIVEKDQLNIPAYNVCGDHMHLLLVCEKEEVEKNVGKIKAMTARATNIAMGRTLSRSTTRGHAPLSAALPPGTDETSSLPPGTGEADDEPAKKQRGETQTQLWTQKYGCTEIKTEKQLQNTFHYIENNREKHELPENKELKKLTEQITCTIEHAFRAEYKGGFDVVIGNPPYVQSHSLSENEKSFIYNNYKTVEYQINTYGIFVEQFIKLLKKNSLYSLIIPNYWLSTKYDKTLRKNVFIDNYALELINTFRVFESATVDTLILTGQKSKPQKRKTYFSSISSNLNSIDERLNAINLRLWEYEEFRNFEIGDEENTINFTKELKLTSTHVLGDFFNMFQGMKPYEKGKGIPSQTREMMNSKIYNSNDKIDETYLPLLGAKHIKRNFLAPYQEYIKYGKNLAAPRNPEIFEGERILVNRILSKEKIDAVLVSDTYVNNTDVFNLLPLNDNQVDVKALYAIIISKLCAFFLKSTNINLNRNAFPKINVNTLEAFPMPDISNDIQERMKILVDEVMFETSRFYNAVSKFNGLLKDNLGLVKLSKKLIDFYKFDFKDLLGELIKQKIALSLSDQAEWKEYFEETKSHINDIKRQLKKTENEIDQMVYELYDLTEDEIKIVEEAQ